MSRAIMLLPLALAAIPLLTLARTYGQVDSAGVNTCVPWPATDALGRELPAPNQVGAPKPDRFVGIFYFLWHDQRRRKSPHWDGPYDLSKILARDSKALNKPESDLWGSNGTYPQVYGYTDDPDQPEQVNVSVAQNLRQSDGRVTNMSDGNARGRSFHGGRVERSPGAVNYGYNFQEQWQRALQVDPPFVMVTGWNEWIAGRWRRPGKPLVFVDQLDQEFSRDIEPVQGAHSDNYYYQLVANVRRYKGTPSLPEASAPRSIRIDKGFGQWNDVQPAFRDHIGETAPRDSAGAAGLRYTNNTGRNDLVAAKVTRDAEIVSFYVRTTEPLSPASDPNWMWLVIDADGDAKTGWEGFDFIVNREVEDGQTTWLEKNAGGWNWEKVEPVSYRVEDNQLHLAVPRAALDRSENRAKLTLDFKWIDNSQHPGDILDGYASGDAAPEGRFRYRYVAADD